MEKKMIQTDKLSLDHVPEDYFPRPQLTQLYNQLDDNRLLFIQAPGGYGKTSSTAYWLKQRQQDVLWISLDEYDNLPSLFYKLCVNALLISQPDNTALAEIVSHSDFVNSPVEFTLLALDAFKNTGQPFVLAMDNFDLITNKKILSSLTFVLKRFTLTTKVILLSRNNLPFELENYYGLDQIVKITKTDLAFSETDILNFYLHLGQKRSVHELKTIFTHTEGWPIAVHTLAENPKSLPLKETTTNQLTQYIELDIWVNWSDEIKLFLIKLGVLNEINLELAIFLTGEKQSREILEKLAQETILIQQVSPTTFRFHSLFKDFLEERLSQVSSFSLTEYYKRITRYYMQTGDVFYARHFALKSHDEALIIKSMLDPTFYNDYHASIEEHVETILNFQVNHLPERIYLKQPIFHLIPAWYYFLNGDLKRLTYHLDALLINFNKILVAAPKFIHEVVLILGLDPRYTLVEKISSISTIINLPEIEQGEIKNTAIAPTKTISLSLQLPFLHRGLVDYYEFNTSEIFVLAKPHFEAILQDYYQATFDLISGGLHLEKNDLTTAFQDTYRGYAKIDELDFSELHYSAILHLMHIYYLREDLKEFNQLKSKLEKEIDLAQMYFLSPNFQAYLTRLELWQGNQAAAKDWLANYFVVETKQIELFKIFQHFTTIRAYLLLDKKEEALMLAEKLLNFSRDFKRLTDEAEITVLLSIIYWQLGNQKDALDLLEQLLSKTHPYHLIRVYADEGDALLPILKKLKTKLHATKTASTEIQAYLGEIIIATTEITPRHKGIVPELSANQIKLSKQQLRMLELLAQGYKFNDIVELTKLSINTIRSHVSLAYQKLGVNNSHDAISKAKKLGLLK